MTLTDPTPWVAAVGTPSPAALREMAATLLSLAGVRTGETVVDLACGGGLLARSAAAAAGRIGRVLGAGTEPRLLEQARARGDDLGVAWLLAEAGRMPLPGGSVHKALWSTDSAQDPVGVLTEVRRVLRPGGRLATAWWGDAAGHDPAALLPAYGLRPVHSSQGLLAVEDSSAGNSAPLPVRYVSALRA